MTRADGAIRGRYGLQLHDPSRFVPRMEHYVTGPLMVSGLPPANGDIDRCSKVTSWPMYANDEWGDCVWAMIGHSIQAMTTYANTEVTVPVESLLKGYSDVTGFDPNAGPSGQNPTDQGTNILDALKYWRDMGIVDASGKSHKIVAFAQFGDPTDEVLLAQALNIFGTVLLGYTLQKAQEDQFDQGEPWRFVQGSPIVGGHAICAQRRAVGQAGVIEDITWAAVQHVTRSAHRKLVSEAWSVVTEDWLDAQGASIQNYKLDQLLMDMKYV